MVRPIQWPMTCSPSPATPLETAPLETAQLEAYLGELQAHYDLGDWQLEVKFVPNASLGAGRAAELYLEEPYRYARVDLADSLRSAPFSVIAHILEHEVQHVALWPLDALRALVLECVPDALSGPLKGEFNRVNERLRATLERVQKKGALLESARG